MNPQMKMKQDWTTASHQYIDDRAMAREEFLKSEVSNMLGQFQTRTGRWDMEGMKLFLAETIPKAAGVHMAD